MARRRATLWSGLTAARVCLAGVEPLSGLSPPPCLHATERAASTCERQGIGGSRSADLHEPPTALRQRKGEEEDEREIRKEEGVIHQAVGKRSRHAPYET